MRNLKKFLALVLAMIMVVSATAMVSADFTDVAADSKYAAAINDLAVKGIVKGTSDTTFGPEQDVTRWQMALFVARAITGEVESDDVWANGIVPFTDVTSYKGAIQCAYLNGIINGTSATTFAPNDGITYVAALKMAVCALGYGEDLTWPWGYYNKAAELGLTANMDLDDLNVELNRAETAQIIYNMIYAAPADGGKTFAAENFSIAAPENTTLFAITATPKQYGYTEVDENEEVIAAYNSASDVDGEFVGLQQLINGVPAGKMLYVAVETIGLTAENVEDYFNYAIELVNFDEATGAFTGYVMGDAPKTITHADVKFASSNDKLVIDGATYTGVDSFTGASLINELVIYNGTGVAENAKMLLTNKDGDIIDETGEVIAVFAYESSTGAKYYYDGSSKKVITAAKALEDYGVFVDDAESTDYIKYETLTSANNEIEDTLYLNAFEMKMFDDDRDGKYERAYYAPIYMSVYYTFKAEIDDKEVDADGLVYTVYGETVAADKVAYTNEAAKKEGAVSVFTYNEQLDKINVIDVLEMKTGYVEEIDSTKYNATHGYGAVKVTVDGVAYEIGYDYAKVSGQTTQGSAMGATLIPYDDSNSNKYGVDKVATRPFIQYIVDRATWIDDLQIDTYIGFYAYNGVIIYASELEISNLYEFVVVEDFADYDLAKIYLDLWVGGELEEEALVTELDGKELEDLSTYKFSMLLSEKEYFYTGNIYAAHKVEDAYVLDEIITVDNFVDYELIDAKIADEDYVAALAAYDAAMAEDPTQTAVEAPAGGEIVFDDGSTRGADRATRIRTSKTTVFYFIENAECDCKTPCDPADPAEKCDSINDAMRTVSVFVGQPDDATIKFNDDTAIWVDALGHGTAETNGRASVVFVINPEEHSGFFGLTDATYVLTNLSTKATKLASAEKLGLPKEYDGTYYMYSNAAISLDDASRMNIYSKVELKGNYVYKVDANGVVYLKDSANFGAGAELTDTENHQLWTSAGVVSSMNTRRNYVKYGITDMNGEANTTADAQWAEPNGTVRYHDFVWYDKANTKQIAEAQAEFAELLAEVANKAIAGEITTGAEYADALGYDADESLKAATDVMAFLADLVAAGNEVDADDIEFEDIPDTIYEVELITPLVHADFVDDYVEVEILSGDNAGTYLIDEDDHITDIIVVKQNGLGVVTGEDAIELLNSAPQVMWIGEKDATGVMGELFSEYLVDGSILFVVGYANNVK